MMGLRNLLVPLLVFGAGAGCAPVLRIEGTVTNPLAVGVRTLDAVLSRPRMSSQKGVYDRLDRPSTEFRAVVAGGEVRAPDDVDIQVQIWHEWPELADPRAYKIAIKADNGSAVAPDAVVAEPIVMQRDRLDTRTEKKQTVVRRDAAGRAIGSHESTSMGIGEIEEDVYRGRAKFRFRKPVLTRNTRRLTLEMRNSKQVFVFTWNFSDHGVKSSATVLGPSLL